MTFIQQIQKLFNDHPIVSGIVLFLSIVLLVVLVWSIIVLIIMRRRKKLTTTIIQTTENNTTKSSKETEVEINPSFKYYVLKKNEIGNLVIQNLNDKNEVIDDITREVIESIFSSENSRLFLPEGNVEVYSNQTIDQFGLSAPIEKNSFNETIFEYFIDYVEYHLAPWSKPKFKM